jgi:hypothetical protein
MPLVQYDLCIQLLLPAHIPVRAPIETFFHTDTQFLESRLNCPLRASFV